MADCYGCPYRWHDSDCEYCSAMGDKVIDGSYYKKENCSYYKEYLASKSNSSSSHYSSSSSNDLGIDPKKGGKCWSCKYCEDVATQTNNPSGEYYRKCLKSGKEYIDKCKFYCSDYIWDGKTAQNSSFSSSSNSYSSSSSGSSYSSSSSSSSSSSGGSGCGVAIVVILIIAALIGGGAFLIPKIFGGRSETGVAQQATAVVYNVNYALNMRDAASSDSNVITTIPKGETVQILELGTDYHYVQYGEYQGYCAAECLQIQ